MWSVFVIFTLLLILVFVKLRLGNRVLVYSHENDRYTEPTLHMNIITDEENKYIIDKSKSLFTTSTTVGSDKPTEVRTSETAWIHKDDPVVGPMIKRICDQFQLPVDNAESLQIVKYKPGAYYREHHDSCCDNNDSCKKFSENSGQRIRTILVYLNDEFEGGETHFPNLDKKLKAPRNGAIVFYPMSTDTPHACHPKALHAGLPVTSGEKYVCNIWIRERKWST